MLNKCPAVDGGGGGGIENLLIFLNCKDRLVAENVGLASGG